jgi:hypothetical protein
MRKFLMAACVAALAAFGPIHGTKAASVDVDVDITLPSFLILYCYDNIAINIDPADLGTALGATNDSGVPLSGVAGPSGGYTSAASTITAQMNIAADAGANLATTVDLVLQDTCGVRALASGGTATITVPSNAGTLEAAGGAGNGSIAVSSVTTSDSGPSGLTLTGGLGTLNTFDVTMSLDLAGVIAADTFSDTNEGGVEFVIDVVTP